MSLAKPLPDPEFDTHGYPTAKTLRAIKSWRHTYISLIGFVRRAWYYPDYVWKEGKAYHFATGGWSGNESLIGALEGNYMFWAMCWQKSERGGLHVFEIPTGLEETKILFIDRRDVPSKTPIKRGK